jgi:hypothetical protein
VKELGFLWKKTRNSRVVLIEKHDVRWYKSSFSMREAAVVSFPTHYKSSVVIIMITYWVILF